MSSNQRLGLREDCFWVTTGALDRTLPHPTKGGSMLKRINSEMGVIFDEIEIEEVIAPLL